MGANSKRSIPPRRLIIISLSILGIVRSRPYDVTLLNQPRNLVTHADRIGLRVNRCRLTSLIIHREHQ